MTCSRLATFSFAIASVEAKAFAKNTIVIKIGMAHFFYKPEIEHSLMIALASVVSKVGPNKEDIAYC